MRIVCSGIVFCYSKFRNTVKDPYYFSVESSTPTREGNPEYAVYVGFILIHDPIKPVILSSASEI